MLVTGNLNPNLLGAFIGPFLDLEEMRELVLVSDEPGPDLPKLVTEGPPRALRRLLGRAGAKLLLCLRLAVRLRPRLFLSYNLVPHGLTSLIVGRAVGLPCVVHLIGGPREWQGGGWTSDNAVLGRLPFPVKPLEAVLTRVIAGHTKVLVMGPSAKRELIARGISDSKVHVVPASVDPDRFPERSGDAIYDIVTASQLNERKRIHEFLDAAQYLRASFPGIRCAIAGTGPLEQSLREYARSLGIDDCVDFLGFRADIEEVFARSRIFVLPSRSEGLSVAMSEAMMSGLPVVVTDVGETAELVQSGENGYLFPVGDVEALVEAVAALLKDPELLKRTGGAARRDALRLSGRERIKELSQALLNDLGS